MKEDRMGHDYADSRDYDDYERRPKRRSFNYEEERDEATMDTRRGVRGSGRGSRMRRDRAEEDYYDEDDEEIRLPRRAISQWKRNLVNADGTSGPHFKHEDLIVALDNMNLDYENYTKADVCMVANMLYSDFCVELKRFIPPDKEVYAYIGLARAFLEDDDGLEGSEKVASYYYCIANARRL